MEVKAARDMQEVIFVRYLEARRECSLNNRKKQSLPSPESYSFFLSLSNLRDYIIASWSNERERERLVDTKVSLRAGARPRFWECVCVLRNPRRFQGATPQTILCAKREKSFPRANPYLCDTLKLGTLRGRKKSYL